MKAFEAGFDITVISGEAWRRLMRKYGLKRVDDRKEGWTWIGAGGEVVAAYDPVSGVCHLDRSDVRPDFASYIGISGTADFVAGLFVDIKESAEFIKAENFGKRHYI